MSVAGLICADLAEDCSSVVATILRLHDAGMKRRKEKANTPCSGYLFQRLEWVAGG